MQQMMPTYLQPSRSRHLRRAGSFAERLSVRFAFRAGAVGLIALTLGHGLLVGDHLNKVFTPGMTVLGTEVADYFGHAAEHIRISGLTHKKPQAVLDVLGIKPGGSLIGFNAAQARKKLEQVDWIASAHLHRITPDTLEIRVVEREPFVIWQHSGQYTVVDKTGIAMTSLNVADYSHLLLVTGAGAQEAARELVNHIEAYSVLKSRIRAAARVGQRRWTLYLANGMKVALPQDNFAGALKQLNWMQEMYQVFDKGVASIDLRLPGKAILASQPRAPSLTRLQVVSNRQD